jgi:catechol 2,3-dioxygenase
LAEQGSVTPVARPPRPLDPRVRIGHVHLRVADLERAIGFYRDVLGFAVNLDLRSIGLQVAFLAAGDYHHQIALNATQSEGGTPPPPGHTGLYHFALVYPDRRELGRAVKRVLDHGHTIDHATDHGATVGVHICDPDGNGIELYYDRPRSDWLNADGTYVVMNRRIDYRELLDEVAEVAS